MRMQSIQVARKIVANIIRESDTDGYERGGNENVLGDVSIMPLGLIVFGIWAVMVVGLSFFCK